LPVAPLAADALVLPFDVLLGVLVGVVALEVLDGERAVLERDPEAEQVAFRRPAAVHLGNDAENQAVLRHAVVGSHRDGAVAPVRAGVGGARAGGGRRGGRGRRPWPGSAGAAGSAGGSARRCDRRCPAPGGSRPGSAPARSAAGRNPPARGPSPLPSPASAGA